MNNLNTFLRTPLIAVAMACSVLVAHADTYDDHFKPANIDPEFQEAWVDIPYKGFGYYFFENFLIDVSDEGWTSDDKETLIINDVYAGVKMDAENHRFHWDDRAQGKWDGNYWRRYWKRIEIINTFLEKLNSGTSGYSGAEKSRYVAEARTLRAFYYLQLVKFYGALPIVTTPMTDASWYGVGRQPAWKVLQFVVDDCRAAIACADLPWAITLGEANRMSRAIAAAIMSQASMYAASPLFCDDQNLWEYAYAVNKEAFDALVANGYALYTELLDPASYSSAYQEYFATRSYAGINPADRETIWEGNVIRASLWDINSVQPMVGGFKPGTIPTQELVDAYDMLATGKPIYDLANPYVDEKHSDININAASGYDPANPYEGRDPRFYANTVYDRCMLNTGIRNRAIRTYNNTEIGGKRGNAGIDKVQRVYTRTGYYNHKYHAFKSTSSTKIEGGNWKYYRLGEVYLNLAETAIEAGHIDEGLKLINEIRHRAGFDPAVDVKAASQQEARLLLRHERQVELAFEEHRYFDVRRWGKPGTDIQEEKYNTGMWITTSLTSDTEDIKYSRFVLGQSEGNTPSKMTYEARNRLLPIPADEATRLATLSGKKASHWQNEGYYEPDYSEDPDNPVDVDDIMADTWVGTDDLGRVTPTADDQALRTDKDRIVAIFYVTWHDNGKYTSMQAPYAGDVTKVLEGDPEARKDAYHPLWIERSCHWGEPEAGYFLSRDEWVIRHDMSMLTDAGVDLLVLDCTNGVTYGSEWDKVMSTMQKMKQEGNRVPKICFWVYNNRPTEAAEKIWDYYYSGEGKFKDLWFYWDGKPLLLYNANPELDANGSGYEAKYSDNVLNFFTLRNMWWGYYSWNGKRYVGTEDNWSFGYDMHDKSVSGLAPADRAARHNGRLEQMCVTPAQHSSTMVGKSWDVDGGEPSLDVYDMPMSKWRKIDGRRRNVKEPTKYGFYFQDRWDEALSVDPDLIYINDWNEWTAGMFCETHDFMGRTNNPFYFVDQYNAEFNRTIQPMKGGYTDNYYMQMVQNIRRYKGVRPIPVSNAKTSLTSASGFSMWNDVKEEYRDTRGDIFHRDNHGYGGLHYTNTSGRNDIVLSKVSMGDNTVSFYVQTTSALTPYTDPNWMLLFVDIDGVHDTGWYGYDFLINSEFASAEKTVVKAWDATAKAWTAIGDADFRTEGNKLVVTIDKSLLGIDATAANGSFDFKWSDNPAKLETVIDLCTDGDAAPNRRFNYRYIWNYEDSGIDDVVADDETDTFRVNAVKGGIVVDSDRPFTVSTTTGIVVARGQGHATISLTTGGLYVVTDGRAVRKIAVL